MHNVFITCFHLWFCLLSELNLCEAILQRPSIMISARYATYLTGESVFLECQITMDFTIHGYKFFKNNVEVRGGMESSTVNKYRIRTAKRSDSGSYTCLYWISDARGRQESDISLPVSLSVIDQPSTPSLSVKPQQTLYFEGETVTLECEHPVVNSQISYHFYKDTTKVHSYLDSTRSEYHISSLSTKDSGTYNCEYLVLGHQRTIPSGKSMQQTIAVTALSTSPLLKFLPSYITFIKGENLTMECEAPTPVHVTIHRFYKDGEELKGPSSHRGIYTLQNVTKEDQAEYTCMYWSPKSNREIPSNQSPINELYIIEPLRPPLLFADPPSGRIRAGGNVTLYCVAPEEYERTKFHFLNATDEIISVSSYKNQKTAAVTINMRKSNSTSATKYICQYTADIKGRLLLSPKSPQIDIIVVATGSFWWLIALGVGAGIAVLLIFLGLIYWVLLGKKDKKKDKEESKPIHNGGCKVTSL
ncbi:immunoglobulin superfamily member 1-like isoform X1 [Ranitomeya variabilis]|uniref:immunoglobulin superfamily member 1-like isoform X1 n=1 Tax=Ranitomeya variabilis TaxID=490064 RepID=UPI004055E969